MIQYALKDLEDKERSACRDFVIESVHSGAAVVEDQLMEQRYGSGSIGLQEQVCSDACYDCGKTAVGGLR